MVILEDGTVFNHCFCYLGDGPGCDRSDCTVKYRGNVLQYAILNKEIYAQGTGNPTEDAAVFAYQEVK